MKEEEANARAAERMETEVMRERIHNVAAEVACLTAVLEGPNSPVATILAAEAARHAAGNGAGNENSRSLNDSADPANSSGPRGSLADRIRALQSKRLQLPQSS